MAFNSYKYLIFFPIVATLYFIIPNKFKNLWLVLSSYVFYMFWNIKYSLILLFSTVVTYFAGLYIDKINKNDNYNDKQKLKYKKITVAFVIVVNLGMLICLKYLKFILNIFEMFANLIGLNITLPIINILLPVGISYYTFQVIGYIIDVYRNDIEAESNFIKYALFVSFFPHLADGPVERSRNLLHQFDEPKKFDFDNFREGFLIILWGYFLKLVIADRLAIFVDTIFENYTQYVGLYMVIAAIFLYVQTYCDLYGYSLIAMGSAKILGYNLMENFNAPLLSKSVVEFWSKWHISISSWFKDYLFLPLLKLKNTKPYQYICLVFVFLCSGLWHGASIPFVIWGILNGLYQVIGYITKPYKNKLFAKLHLNKKSFGHKLMQTLATFLLISFSVILFKANSLKEIIEIIKSMFSAYNPWILFDGSLYQCGLDIKNYQLVIVCIVILFFAEYCKANNIIIRKFILKQDYWFRWLFISLAICAILTFGIWGPSYDASNFIYFQF